MNNIFFPFWIKRRIFCYFLAFSCIGAAVQPLLAQETASPSVHDPVIIKAENSYYIFFTGGKIQMLQSDDLKSWKRVGEALPDYPDWAKKKYPDVKSYWAPDISYFDGKYHLYYSVSRFGKNTSSIGLATNEALDKNSPKYKWNDEGEVVSSEPGKTNYNAIDPNVAFDEKGTPWLSFGSFWGGIQMCRLDPATGKPAGEIFNIAGRNGGAIEAPYIIRHDGRYYLFVSFDFCCKGVNSNYNIRVGRSDKIEGPYLDRDGKKMIDGGGTLVLEGKGDMRGPGHNAFLSEKSGDFLVYHFYDAARRGQPMLKISPVKWSQDGWPEVDQSAEKTPSDGK